MADFLLRSTSSTERQNSTAYALGDRIVIARADAQSGFANMRKYVYECTTAGTTAGSAPIYPTTPGGTVSDGSVVWTCRECQTWANAARYADYIANNRMAAGDRLFASQAHAETSTVSLTITFPGTVTNPCYFLCVDDSIGGNSPTTVSTGASVSNSGSVTLSVNGSVIGYGVAFTCGSGSGNLSLNQTANIQEWTLCDFVLGASATQLLILSASGSGSVSAETTLNNCRYQFGNTASRIKPSNIVSIQGGSIISGGTTPTSIFSRPTSNTPVNLSVSGLDFSNLGSTVNLVEGGSFSGNNGAMILRNSKLPSSWSGSLLSAAITTIGFNVAAYNLDYADTNYSVWLEDYSGSVRHDTALYLSGTDGIKLNGAAVPLCYKMTASANVMPLEGLWRVIVNEVTTSQTATLEIIHNEAAALNDGEIWLELEYPVTGGSAQFARLTDKSNLLATPATQTTSSADWDDGLSERANSTVYAVGNIIKSSGSPGSAFICTVSGTSAGSVPGGYTSAADGASITDGSATFKAMRRQKLQVPFTAAEQGVIRARAVLAKSNAVVWVASKLAVA